VATGPTNIIGGGYFSNYSGLLDQVAIFDQALSAAEISDIITNGLGAATATAAVPEPSTFAMLGIGSVGLLCVRRRKRKPSDRLISAKAAIL
jgi:Zn-dependent alcohol dehydrogenase